MKKRRDGQFQKLINFTSFARLTIKVDINNENVRYFEFIDGPYASDINHILTRALPYVLMKKGISVLVSIDDIRSGSVVIDFTVVLMAFDYMSKIKNFKESLGIISGEAEKLLLEFVSRFGGGRVSVEVLDVFEPDNMRAFPEKSSDIEQSPGKFRQLDSRIFPFFLGAAVAFFIVLFVIPQKDVKASGADGITSDARIAELKEIMNEIKALDRGIERDILSMKGSIERTLSAVERGVAVRDGASELSGVRDEINRTKFLVYDYGINCAANKGASRWWPF